MNESVYSAANGSSGTRIATDVVWNRFANVSGGARRNLELDFLNELRNNEFKGILFQIVQKLHL